MLDFESARRRFIEAAKPVGSDRVSLFQAVGRVLAEPLHAERPVPEFDTSAMDGYAVNVDDVTRVPFELPVEGEAPAGAAPGRLVKGTAMRIFTGAAVPEGGNAVVMQEHVVREGDVIRGRSPVTAGQNVRRRGEDMHPSALALDRGQRLHPGALALVSFLDRAEVEVWKAPRIAILCTGSELRTPGSASRPGAIVESNSLTIATLARQTGAIVTRSDIVDDDAVSVKQSAERALAEADVLVTIGGVSVGDYDFVRPALESMGFVLDLHQVGIKPGKPIALGRRGSKIVIGLPGNPASAVVTFSLFGAPLLRAIQGDRLAIPVPTWCPLIEPIKGDAKRTRIVLGKLLPHDSRSAFLAHRNQASGATIALGQTDGFVIVAPTPATLDANAQLPFLRWTDL